PRVPRRGSALRRDHPGRRAGDLALLHARAHLDAAGPARHRAGRVDGGWPPRQLRAGPGAEPARPSHRPGPAAVRRGRQRADTDDPRPAPRRRVRRPVGQRGSRSGTLRAELAKKAAVVGSVRVVLEVARTGSFSAAAERLGYTQSAVSRQVAVTERAVGTPLFERHARGTRPTPAGEALARHAGKVLDEIAAATQELAGRRA